MEERKIDPTLTVEYWRKKITKLDVKFALMDLIFDQHTRACQGTNILILSVQMLLLIIGVILRIIGYNIMPSVCLCSIVLCVVLGVSIKIHEYAWSKSKQTLKELDSKLDELLEGTILKDE